MLSNIIYSLIYLRSMTLGCKDIGIRKSEFVGKLKVFVTLFSRKEGGSEPVGTPKITENHRFP